MLFSGLAMTTTPGTRGMMPADVNHRLDEHAFVGAAEAGRHRHRRDHELHPAIDRNVVQIGRAARLGGRDRLAQGRDDLR